MPYYLQSHELIDAGLRRIAKEQIDIGLRDFADAAVPEHRKVHSMRIRCKKVRGALRLIRPILGEERFEIEDQRFRAAARQIAGNRDEVICARLIVALGGSIDSAEFSPRPVRMQDLQQSVDMLRSGKAAIDAWPVALEGFHDVAAGFGRTYRKCLDAWDAVREESSDELFHRFRRMAKYHWYHIRILERLNKVELRPRREVLRSLQRTIGDAHDYFLLESYLKAREDSGSDMMRQAVTRKNELYAEAIRLGETVFDVRVERLVADCAGYWADRKVEKPASSFVAVGAAN